MWWHSVFAPVFRRCTALHNRFSAVRPHPHSQEQQLLADSAIIGEMVREHNATRIRLYQQDRGVLKQLYEAAPYVSLIMCMAVPKRNLYFLLVLGAVLLGIAFPPIPFGLTAFIGFLPLFLAFEKSAGLWQTFRWSYCAFFVFHGVGNWWVSSWQPETDPYLMASGIALWLVHPLFFAVPMVVYTFLRQRLGRTSALSIFPFVWTSFEWLHSLGEASYPWLALGYTQALHTTFAQMADLGGVWLVSFVVVAVNVVLAQLLFIHREEQRFSIQTPMQWLRLPHVWRRVLGVVLFVVVPLAYGIVQRQTWAYSSMLNHTPTTTIAVVQPNINPWKKWDEGGMSPYAQMRHAIALQDSLIRATGKPDLVIWSETAIPFRILAPVNAAYMEELRQWVDTSGVALLSGFPDDTLYTSTYPPSARKVVIDRDTLLYDSYNAAMLLVPRASLAKPPVYGKMKLTPFAERLPYADAFTFAMSWVEWGVGISAWGIGPGQRTLDYPVSGDTARVGCIICIESIYPDFVANFVRRGANVLTVITNDGWYNFTAGPHQHYWIAAMRAIETRRYIARCANTGISGFISPAGEALQYSSIDTQLAMKEKLPLIRYQSVYVQLGDWLPMLATALSGATILLAFIRRKGTIL